MKNSQGGFVVPLLITIIAIVLVGGGTYFYSKSYKNPLPTVNNINSGVATTTQDQDVSGSSSTVKIISKSDSASSTTITDEIKSNTPTNLDIKNPNIVNGSYYYPKGIIANTHTAKNTSKCIDVSKDVCDNDSVKDFILKDQEDLNNDKAPIFTSIYEPYPFQAHKPFAQMELNTNNTMVLPSGNKILLAQLIQTDGGRSDSFISAVIFSNNAHRYFPLNSYVGKYKEHFVGPFLEEQAWFDNGQIILSQINANIGEKGQYFRMLTFSFNNGIYTLKNEKFIAKDLDKINKFGLEKIGSNIFVGAPTNK